MIGRIPQAVHRKADTWGIHIDNDSKRGMYPHKEVLGIYIKD